MRTILRRPQKRHIRPDSYYYLWSLKHTKGENKVFWAPNGVGYVYNLKDAGVYRGSEILEHFDHYCNEGTWPVTVYNVSAGRLGNVMTVVQN